MVPLHPQPLMSLSNNFTIHSLYKSSPSVFRWAIGFMKNDKWIWHTLQLFCFVCQCMWSFVSWYLVRELELNSPTPCMQQWLQIYLIVKLYRRVLGYTFWNTSETTNDGLTQTLFAYSFKRGHTLRPAWCLGFWCWEEGGGFISGYSKCLLRKQLYVQHATKGLFCHI